MKDSKRFLFWCPFCNTRLKASVTLMDNEVACPSCKREFTLNPKIAFQGLAIETYQFIYDLMNQYITPGFISTDFIERASAQFKKDKWQLTCSVAEIEDFFKDYAPPPHRTTGLLQGPERKISHYLFCQICSNKANS